jgi:hypothetical protein
MHALFSFFGAIPLDCLRFCAQTVQELGFNTDHGAYYYYHTEKGKNYFDTLVDVKTNSGLPFK